MRLEGAVRSLSIGFSVEEVGEFQVSSTVVSVSPMYLASGELSKKRLAESNVATGELLQVPAEGITLRRERGLIVSSLFPVLLGVVVDLIISTSVSQGIATIARMEEYLTI